jgi:hypothetical protein
MCGKISPQRRTGELLTDAEAPVRTTDLLDQLGAGGAGAEPGSVIAPALAVVSMLAALAWVPAADQGSGYDAHRKTAVSGG